MKNVNGLANAMRLVESACEKGEITIIGEGGMPTPVELYKKCVAYINKQYGVDILNLVLKENKPCECNGTCTTVIVEADEDEVEYIVVHLSKLVEVVDTYLGENMPYLSGEAMERIVGEIRDVYENSVDNIEVDDYYVDVCEDYIYDVLNDNLHLADYDEDCIDELVGAIAKLIDEECVEK